MINLLINVCDANSVDCSELGLKDSPQNNHYHDMNFWVDDF